LGSSRTSLVFQFLAQTLVLCLAAITIAVLLVQPILRLFRDFIPSGVRFNVLDPYGFLFIIAITLITSLLAGLYPARMAAAYLPATSLKGSGLQKGSEKWLLRKGLIVFQFSISLIFIIGTLVIGKQIRYMLHTDFGLKTDAVVILDNWSWKDDMGKARVLREKLSQLPGIQQVIPQAVAPMGWGAWSTRIKYMGKQEIALDVMSDWGNEDFISFYRMRLVAGRNITAGDSLTELVINETCARALGFATVQSALGKFLYFGNNPVPVVGIVADFHQGSFRDAIKPLVIGHQPGLEKSTAIKLSSKGKDAPAIKPVLTSIEKIWKTVYPDK